MALVGFRSGAVAARSAVFALLGHVWLSVSLVARGCVDGVLRRAHVCRGNLRAVCGWMFLVAAAVCVARAARCGDTASVSDARRVDCVELGGHVARRFLKGRTARDVLPTVDVDVHRDLGSDGQPPGVGWWVVRGVRVCDRGPGWRLDRPSIRHRRAGVVASDCARSARSHQRMVAPAGGGRCDAGRVSGVARGACDDG
jgi:hypothetical protein